MSNELTNHLRSRRRDHGDHRPSKAEQVTAYQQSIANLRQAVAAGQLSGDSAARSIRSIEAEIKTLEHATHDASV